MKKNRGGIMSTEKTKLKFLNSFLELMAVRPVNKITVKDISANCGLTPQTFYNHFADKYDLILWAYRVRVDQLN
jgi:AcrR family transcriptional regulator